MTDEKKRRNAGFIGSALIHILIVLVISFTGLLHFSSNTEDIVEVTFFGGGGGGGTIGTVHQDAQAAQGGVDGGLQVVDVVL